MKFRCFGPGEWPGAGQQHKLMIRGCGWSTIVDFKLHVPDFEIQGQQYSSFGFVFHREDNTPVTMAGDPKHRYVKVPYSKKLGTHTIAPARKIRPLIISRLSRNWDRWEDNRQYELQF